ncbi:MAG: hypothetical protein ACRCUT_07070 [Spirochaetota bacterium]
MKNHHILLSFPFSLTKVLTIFRKKPILYPEGESFVRMIKAPDGTLNCGGQDVRITLVHGRT